MISQGQAVKNSFLLFYVLIRFPRLLIQKTISTIETTLSLSAISNSSLYTSTPAHRHSHLSKNRILLLLHPRKVHRMWLLIYTISETRCDARKIRSSFQSFHLTVLNSGTDPQHHNYSNDQQKIRKWSDFHPEIGVLVDFMNSDQPVRIKYHFQVKR